MAFDPGKVHKLLEHLEETAYEWMIDRVRTFYQVEDLSNLTEEQLQEIFLYAESDECDDYVGMALRSIISNYE